jgi:hypothetical protein
MTGIAGLLSLQNQNTKPGSSISGGERGVKRFWPQPVRSRKLASRAGFRGDGEAPAGAERRIGALASRNVGRRTFHIRE